MSGNTERRGRPELSVIVSMAIFGTIGLVRKEIALPSSVVAFFRAAGGALLLAAVTAARGRKTDMKAVRARAVPLLVSGVLLGFNWIALFESYRYTTVAVSTLCYYMAPVLIVLLSPLVLKEKLTLKKLLCVLVAGAGMLLVSGAARGGDAGAESWKGVLLGLAAAVMYAAIVLCNKRTDGIGGTDRTLVQLGVAAAVLLPYALLTGEMSAVAGADARSLLLTAAAAFVHTGLAYTLYFSAVPRITGQSAAILSYIDPVVAVLLSVLVLREPMTLACGIGAGLILLAAVFCEIRVGRREEDKTRKNV